MKIYNEEKTEELNSEELDIEQGYLKPDKLFIAHHEAVEAREAVYQDRVVEEESGGISVYKDLIYPGVEAKAAYDEYEDIQVYLPYTAEEIQERKLAKLRRQREDECFPIINRGQFWYDGLTEAQRVELKAWYTAWLNVTETFEVPPAPEWINKLK